MVKEKLKMLRDKLKIWDKEVFGWLDLDINNNVAELNELDRVAYEGDELEVVEKRKHVSSLFFLQLHFKESLMIKQKSRVKWVHEGNHNTKFIHSCLNSKRRSNHIVLLERDWVVLEEVVDVKREVRRFFSESFKEVDIKISL